MEHTVTSHLESLQATDFDAGGVFSGNPSGRMVRGFTTSSACTPYRQPHASLNAWVAKYAASALGRLASSHCFPSAAGTYKRLPSLRCHVCRFAAVSDPAKCGVKILTTIALLRGAGCLLYNKLR